MRSSKFDEAQFARAVREVDEGASVTDVCRRMGISDTTFYRWRRERAPTTAAEIAEMRAENKKLRVIVANFLLDKLPAVEPPRRRSGP